MGCVYHNPPTGTSLHTYGMNRAKGSRQTLCPIRWSLLLQVVHLRLSPHKEAATGTEGVRVKIHEISHDYIVVHLCSLVRSVYGNSINILNLLMCNGKEIGFGYIGHIVTCIT